MYNIEFKAKKFKENSLYWKSRVMTYIYSGGSEVWGHAMLTPHLKPTNLKFPRVLVALANFCGYSVLRSYILIGLHHFDCRLLQKEYSISAWKCKTKSQFERKTDTERGKIMFFWSTRSKSLYQKYSKRIKLLSTDS